MASNRSQFDENLSYSPKLIPLVIGVLADFESRCEYDLNEIVDTEIFVDVQQDGNQRLYIIKIIRHLSDGSQIPIDIEVSSIILD